jgi:hypothetical protein
MDRLWSCASKRVEPDDQLPEDPRKCHNHNSNQTAVTASNNNNNNDDSNANNNNNSNADNHGNASGSTLMRYALCAVHTPRHSPTRRPGDRPNADKSSTPGGGGRSTTKGTSLTCRRQFFPLPPLALLPCAERQADPSPPSSDDEERGAGRRRVAPVGDTTAPSGGCPWPSARKIESVSERYDVMAILGRGTFGRILLAECRTTRRKTALKVSETRVSLIFAMRDE